MGHAWGVCWEGELEILVRKLDLRWVRLCLPLSVQEWDRELEIQVCMWVTMWELQKERRWGRTSDKASANQEHRLEIKLDYQSAQK